MTKATAEHSLATAIHPTAVVHPTAELAPGVQVGPYAIIGDTVRIGANTHIGPQVLIECNTVVGADCQIANGAVLGTDPQDLKYAGEETFLSVGNRTTIREFATLNRGTAASGHTIVGSDCLLMAYTHVAHDCKLGNHIILSNAANMAGHVVIEDWAIISGLVAIHQFARIGAHSFVGGNSSIRQDVPPFCRVSGNPPKLYGLNKVGLERRGIPIEVRQRLKKAYRVLFMGDLNVSQAVAQVEEEADIMCPEVGHLLDFIRTSERGVTI